MPARTGRQYLQRLQERPPALYLHGQKVTDPTTHPGLSRGAQTIARLYDLQHQPEGPPMTYPSPTTGQPVGLSFITPQTPAHLDARREMMRRWAQQSCGMMGRTPDFLNVSLMAMAAAGDYFAQDQPQFKQNIQNYYQTIREQDLVLTHTLVNLQRHRNPETPDALTDHTEIALSVTNQTDNGITVHGARLLATLPIADEIAVYPARSHRLPTAAPAQTSFAFAIPTDTPGLKFLCRESLDLNRPPFDHPLASRFEEMDALAFFDQVFVPWERVFLLGDPDRCNNMSRQTHQYLHSGHQVVTKNVVKLEFVLGLANLMQQTLGSTQQPQMLQMTAEIIEALETTKALLRAAEADAAPDQWGVLCPAEMPLTIARHLFIRIYPRMGEILQLMGSSSLMALPTQADLTGPLADHLTQYLDTQTQTAQNRTRIFRLAWDACCSAFASRQILYERFFQGDAQRNTVLLNTLYDKQPATNFVQNFLDQE